MNRAERRRQRLEMLIEEVGTQAELASRAHTPPSMLSQVVTRRRRLGNDLCVKLERGANKPDGWLDQWLPNENPYDGTFLTEEEARLLRMIRQLGPEKRSQLLGWLEVERATASDAPVATVHILETRVNRLKNGS